MKNQKFNVVYCDPPWSYKNTITGGTGVSSSNSHYETMNYNELSALYYDLDTIVSDDAVLFLWSTTPLLDTAMNLIADWDFTYKTTFVWIKSNMLGMGNYYRVNTEFLLVGIRGKNVKPFKQTSTKNYAVLPATKHSEKPEFFRHLIMTSTKDCFSTANIKPKYIELFSRHDKITKWETIGRYLTGETIQESIEKIRKKHGIKQDSI